MTKVFIFHGTGGDPEENWFPWLKKKLEEKGCEVIVPQFATPENQTLETWFQVFNNYKDKVDADTILIGHSVGGSFLLRVLESLEKPVKASFFVATPIGIPPIVNWSGDAPYTGHPFDWERIRKNGGKIFIWHSDTDPYVGMENGKKLAEYLHTDLIFRPNCGHFNKAAGFLEFDELFRKIISIL